MKDRVMNLLVWGLGVWLLVILDQYTKRLAVLRLKGKEPLVLWEHVFELLYSENRGAAFGMMQGRQGFFFLIAVVVLGAALYIMWRAPSWRVAHYHGLKICVILITAGALGNMIDRLGQGYVVDFLYFSLIDFPVFNVADIYVTTATGVLALLMLTFYSEEDLDVFRPRKKEAGA